MEKRLNLNIKAARNINNKGRMESKYIRRAAFFKLAQARDFCEKLLHQLVHNVNPQPAQPAHQTIEDSRATCVVNVFSSEKKCDSDMYSLGDIPLFFIPDLLVELIAEDKNLRPSKQLLETAISRRASRGASIAIPSSLRQADLAYVHKVHTAQETMI